MLHLPSKNQEFAACTDPVSLLSEHALTVKVSITSIARCKDPTVIGTFPIVLFVLITVCSLEIQLALLKPLANFFTPILFYSHAFQFVYNLIGFPLWPFELLVLSTSLQWFMY